MTNIKFFAAAAVALLATSATLSAQKVNSDSWRQLTLSEGKSVPTMKLRQRMTSLSESSIGPGIRATIRRTIR